MAEPPKPITELAEPIDRSAPPGRNRLGVVARWLSILAWVAVFAGAALHQPMAAGVAGLLVMGAGIGLAVAGVALGVAALLAAWRNNLDSRPAYKAIFLIVVPLVLFICYLIVAMLWSRGSRHE
jgi:hypothetical protein